MEEQESEIHREGRDSGNGRKWVVLESILGKWVQFGFSNEAKKSKLLAFLVEEAKKMEAWNEGLCVDWYDNVERLRDGERSHSSAHANYKLCAAGTSRQRWRKKLLGDLACSRSDS